MTLEQRLSDALHSADQFNASPDLFARVERSVAEDRLHRRRVLRNVTAALLAGLLVAAYLMAVVDTDTNGRLFLSRGAVQVVDTVVMTLLVVTVGPSIRRFGRNYIDDVFHASPATGARVLKLLDTAYYLVFSGVIMTSATFTRLDRRVSLGGGMEHSLDRIGRLMLAMGLLHALTLMVLPVVGFVFSSVVWRAGRMQSGSTGSPISDGARQSERVIRVGMIIFAVAVSLLVLTFLLLVVVGILDP